MDSVSDFELHHGLLADLLDNPFPTAVRTWRHAGLAAEAAGTHFGYVAEGPATLRAASGTYPLQTGMYFSAPGEISVEHGSGLIVTRLGFRGFFHLGGPVEDTGRLRYIDGCTDSLLIPPVVQGDPCLNLLHIPPHTRQSRHSHPSLRVGLVIRGRGLCVTPEQTLPLEPLRGFVIAANRLHGFETQDSSLLIVAYHPDSDWGPTHENHPMINRTILA